MFKHTLAATLLLTGFSFTQVHSQAENPKHEEVIHHPANQVQPETIKAAFLGVTAERVTPAMNSQLKLPEGLGLVVTHVVPDGPAAIAGLQKHDVLHKLDDQLLVNFEQFAVLVRLRNPGDSVALTFIRGGETRTLEATLTERDVPRLPLTLPKPPMMWFGHDGTGPFSAAPFDAPRIDTERIEAEISRSMPERWLPRVPGNIIHDEDRYQLRIVDGEHKILIDKLDGQLADVTVEDAEGQLIYLGKWDPGSDATAELPADVTKKIREALAAPRVGQPVRIRVDESNIRPGKVEDQSIEWAPATPDGQGGV